MIRHLVALRYSQDTSEETKTGLIDDLAGLLDRIDGLVDFQARANISPEDAVVRGFLDVFWFDCRDISVRDAYLVDPVHQAIGARIVAATDGGVDGVLVIDVEL